MNHKLLEHKSGVSVT